MFSFELDHVKKLVMCTVSGVLTVPDALEFNRRLGACAEEARRKFGHFWLLADATRATTQPAAVVETMAKPGDLLRDPGDKWAVAVESVLAKLQANRAFAEVNGKAFTSLSEAEAWLLEGDGPPQP